MNGWAAGAGAIGLAAFAAGNLLAALPGIDATDSEVVADLGARRGRVVAGGVVGVVGALLPAAVAWRDVTALPPAVVRLALDASHLATWSVSAPVGAVSTAVTTASAVRADLAGGALGTLLVVLAGAKAATVAVELAGTGRRTGWNAGGWAAGSSGYVTVAWFAMLTVALAGA